LNVVERYANEKQLDRPVLNVWFFVVYLAAPQYMIQCVLLNKNTVRHTLASTTDNDKTAKLLFSVSAKRLRTYLAMFAVESAHTGATISVNQVYASSIVLAWW